MARQYARVPLKIASIYAVIGFLWILFSDRGVALFAADPELLTLISMVKGWVYVLLTAVLLYWLIRRHIDAARAVEDRLKASEEKFASAFSRSPALMTISDIDSGCFSDVNEQFCQLTGFSRQEAIGRTSVELGWISAADREQLLRVLRRDGRVAGMEIDLTAKDGRAVSCLYSGEFITSEGQQRLLSIAVDITESKRAATRLHDSELKYRNFFDAATDAIFILDLDGNLLDVNKAAYTRLGYTKEELLALHISQLDPPEFAALVPDRLKKVREQGGHVFESAHYRKDGSTMPVEVNCLLHSYEGRNVYFSVIRDISERKQAEQKIRESEERYRRFSALTTDYVYSCRRSGDEPFRVLWLGGAVEEITGFPLEEIMARGCWLPLVHGDDVRRVSSRLLALGPGSRSVDDFRIVRRDGDIRWIHEVCSCEQGEVPGELLLFGASQDITDRKVAEAAVIELNEHLERLVAERTAELQRSNEDLASFSYAVSHEIRAPIARLSGFSTMLGEVCSGDGEAAFMAARIANASRQLQSVVDSILRLSRLTKMELSRQHFDLSALVTRKLQQQLNESPDRQVELVVQAGIMVTADPNLLAICMDNLLGNALKYTGQTLHARVEFGAYDESGRKVCFVRDNGAGFDMTYEEKLYAPFERLHQHQEFPGMGIGLATVKRIIERHGGEVWAESRVGEGATFYFTLGGTPVLSE